MLAPKIELWELSGTHWRLPIRVIWYDALAEVRTGAGANLTKKQLQVSEETLASVGNKRLTSWFLTRTQLLTVAKPSHETDPEEIVEWMPSRAPCPTTAVSGVPDFIHEYCGSIYAIVRDPLIADAIWASFCKWMLHWLVNEQKAIDLEFARILPLPVRKSWASAAAKFESVMLKENKILKSDRYDPDMQKIVDRGVAQYLAGPRVSSFDEIARTFRFTLEIVPLECFHEMVKLRQRKKHRKFVKLYGSNHRQTVLRLLPYILEAYSNYLAEAKWPTGYFISDHARSGLWAEVIPNRTSEPWHPGISAADASSEVGPAEDVESENEMVPEMPDLQPAEQDMRDTRGDVHGP